jgi:phosphocarrier protein HPr
MILTKPSAPASLQRVVTICNQRGLHARASVQFARMAGEFQADTLVACGELSVPGDSILDLLTLGASCGKEIAITCTGPDAEAALEMLCDLVTRGFDEESDEPS